MGATGAIIMGFFGAVFAAMTLAMPLGAGGWIVALPFLVFLVIAGAAWRVLRMPGSGIVMSKRAETITMWSSIGEGLGLFLAANLVINLGRSDLLMPAMALVVGLHFLPMGFGIPFRPFVVLGGVLLVAAVAGAVTPMPAGGVISGFAAAIALWAAAAMAINRDRLAKRGEGGVKA